MEYFDSHAHLGLISEDPVDQILATKEALHKGVRTVVSINGNPTEFNKVYNVLKTTEFVHHAVGMSPAEVTTASGNWEEEITKCTKLPRVVAIGETGLDYYRKYGNKKDQIELFIKQLNLADSLDLPVIIHNRDAGEDVFEILKQEIPKRGAVLHCYSEDLKYAKRILTLPVYISFAGNVTYKNARQLHETAKHMPLDRMMVESESPFMAPAAFRGKRNRPAYLPAVVECIASLRDEDAEAVAHATTENAKKFFGINASE